MTGEPWIPQQKIGPAGGGGGEACDIIGSRFDSA